MLPTFDRVLSSPVFVYAVMPKYHVPWPRPLTVYVKVLGLVTLIWLLSEPALAP